MLTIVAIFIFASTGFYHRQDEPEVDPVADFQSVIDKNWQTNSIYMREI